ncbi:MAG: hypothetical protein WAJ85_10710 [Candidatus Baltobacteraceae bacterium]|jgi:hypothetical protein
MSQIHEYESVRCPFEDVPKFLDTFFAKHAGEDGAAVVELRAPLGDLKLEHDVLVSLSPLPAYTGYERIAIRWVPTGHGPYPTFQGVLCVSDEGSGFSRLDIDGSYQPPFGAAGVLFDAALGKRLAEAAVRELLANLKKSVEESELAEAAVG